MSRKPDVLRGLLVPQFQQLAVNLHRTLDGHLLQTGRAVESTLRGGQSAGMRRDNLSTAPVLVRTVNARRESPCGMEVPGSRTTVTVR